MLAVLKPLEHIAGDVGLVFAAQHDIHPGNFGDFLALELGIAPSDHHQCIRVAADELSDVLPALAVGQSRHAAGIHHTHVGHLALADRHEAKLGE